MASDSSIGYMVRYAHRAFVKALANELAPHGISTAEWAVLRVLWGHDGYSQAELARRMRIEKASLTGVLREMERRGLLKRVRSASDRRCAILSLTARGRGLQKKLPVCAARINRRATRGFGRKNATALRNLLARTIANLEPKLM
jgi:MarR family transcriptional regulator, organic hydroperoxide resistance regulator